MHARIQSPRVWKNNSNMNFRKPTARRPGSFSRAAEDGPNPRTRNRDFGGFGSGRLFSIRGGFPLNELDFTKVECYVVSYGFIVLLVYPCLCIIVVLFSLFVFFEANGHPLFPIPRSHLLYIRKPYFLVGPPRS